MRINLDKRGRPRLNIILAIINCASSGNVKNSSYNNSKKFNKIQSIYKYNFFYEKKNRYFTD